LIDSQHRMLISYINQLEVHAQLMNPTMEEMEKSFHFVDFLEDYALTHFQDEEQCMFRHRCPAHRENKQAHTDFLEELRRFKQRLGTEGHRSDILQGLHDYCGQWVQSHILRVDTKLKSSQYPYYERKDEERESE
jgi:hemerythrin